MLTKQLYRIPEFRQVAPSEISALAATTRILCIPKHRWLVQREKNLRTYFYLLKGAVRTKSPNGHLKHATFGALNHFYPGCESVRTESACQILLVDADRRDFLIRQNSTEGLSARSEAWLAEFLDSNIMRELSPEHWRAVLRCFTRQEFKRNDVVVSQGAQAEHCFVIEKGHAAVHRAGQTLGYLSPGDFFGEDSLILNARRNAYVTALENMVVHAVSKQNFERWIVRSLVQPVTECGTGERLTLDKTAVGGVRTIDVMRLREQIAELDVKPTYYVVGGCDRERYLAAFILAQKGFRAHPLEVS